MLRFEGSTQLRQRLICSTLSSRPIRIDRIREHDQNPGLRDFEACLLRLLEKITNGCVIEINETGTMLKYKPGVITGSSSLSHDCGSARGIGYFLEPLIIISMFGRKPLQAVLRGITNGLDDPSVDVWRSAALPLLRKASGAEGAFRLKVSKRGAPPLGGGEVHLTVPLVKQLAPITMTDEGLVKRVRGIAHSMRVSPQSSNRMVDGARGVLNQLLADVFVFTDHMSGPEAGLSPGYGVMLVAETTTGQYICSEASAAADIMGQEESVPEEVGRQAARGLFEEIRRGGVVDSAHQGLLLMLCALGPQEVHEVRLGLLTPYAVSTLRHLKAFFGVNFSIKPEKDSQTIFLSCIGAGVRNTSKGVT